MIDTHRLQLPQSLQRSPRKLLVDGLVGQPERLVEDGPVRHTVEQRPQRGVAAAIVVELVVLRAEVDSHHLGAAQLGGLAGPGHYLGLGDLVFLCDAGTRPAQPSTWTQSTIPYMGISSTVQ